MEDFWVFGYGSLMWRPGFEFIEMKPALARGRHRRLCVYSYVHRGTQEKPGLVFGLDNGGTCRGMAFKVAGQRRAETIEYLRARELVTDVYLERFLPIEIHDDAGARKVPAISYIVDRDHPQYTGRLSAEELLVFARQGQGKSGSCKDYVQAAAGFLNQVNWRDPTIEFLSKALGPKAPL